MFKKIMKYHFYLSVLIFYFFTSFSFQYDFQFTCSESKKLKTQSEKELIFNTIYGKFTISEPILVALVNHPAIQRLKKVRQYGIEYYFYRKEEYSRFDHSLGVLYLTRRYGGSLNEQIASLLHDVSHTVFSHLSDFIYKGGQTENSYQDDIHKKYLYKSGLSSVLNKFEISVDQVLPKKDTFKILEQPIPEICTDRLEYNLFGGYLEGILNLDEIEIILKDLNYEQGQWFFNNKGVAKKFANVSLYLTNEKWTSPGLLVRHILGSKLIKRALKIGIIDSWFIHNSVDDVVWNKIISNNDKSIRDWINKLKNFENSYILDSKDFDLFMKPKFRGIDPLIKIDNRLIRLSFIDNKFNKSYQELKEKVSRGYYFKFLN